MVVALTVRGVPSAHLSSQAQAHVSTGGGVEKGWKVLAE
jgi:hypothetical protein